jgi:hypothetical protein
MIKSFCFIFLLLLAAPGCERYGLLEEDRFVVIYADILIASDTTSVNQAREQAFKKHNITEEEYQNTVEYYNNNPEEWEFFFNKVIAHIEEERKASSSSVP